MRLGSDSVETTERPSRAAGSKYAADVGAAGGFSISPQGPVPELPDSPILTDIGTVWDPDRFAVARGPISLGYLEERARFSTSSTTTVSNLPVKFPGSDYRVPSELACATEALQLCITCEHAINPEVDEYYAYLTVDRGRIPAGLTQRGVDIHADWLQGQRVSPKTPIEHGYFATDRDPPRFFNQPFYLRASDIETDSFNAAFEAQARPRCAVRPDPYEVLLFDAYSVHGAVPASTTGTRTFLRFFYSVRIDRRFASGTHNSLFDYDWEIGAR